MHHIYLWSVLFGGGLGLLLVILHQGWEKWYKIDLDINSIFDRILGIGVFFGLITSVTIPIVVKLFFPDENAEVITWNIGAMLIACIGTAAIGYSIRRRRKRRQRLRV